MELRDIDANEAAEPAESSPAEPEQVETPVEPEEEPEVAEEPAQESTEPTEQTEEEPEPAKEPEPKPSKAEQRIKEVVAEKRNLARENEELKARIAQFSSQPAPQLEGDMTVDDLNKMVNERTLQAAELIAASKQVETAYQTQVKEWATDFEQVKVDNPALDPKSPDYDPELDATLARLLDDGRGNPRVDIKVSDVLKTLNKRESETSERAKEEGKSEASAKLAQQSAEGAITPNAKKPSQAEEPYTDEELSEMRVKDPRKYMRELDKM